MTDNVENKQIAKEDAAKIEFTKLYSEVFTLFNGPVCDFKSIGCENFGYSEKFYTLASKANTAKKKFANIKYDRYNDIKEAHKRFYKKVKFIDYMCSTVCEYMTDNNIRPEINYVSRMTHICTIMCYLRMIMDDGLDEIETCSSNRLLIQIQGILNIYIKNNLVMNEIIDRLVYIANCRE